MRALLVVLLLGCVSPLAGQTTARLQTGTVSLPADYCVRSFRGTDSAPGVIQRCDSSFVIHYDIGGMAGAHVHPSRRSEYLWMIEHQAGSLRALTALFEEDGRRRIAMTLYGDDRERWTLPANFFADVRDERDVAEFILISSSYQPRPHESAAAACKIWREIRSHNSRIFELRTFNLRADTTNGRMDSGRTV